MSDITIYDELAILHLKQQDLKPLSPEELYTKFYETKNAIREQATTYKKGLSTLK